MFKRFIIFFLRFVCQCKHHMLFVGIFFQITQNLANKGIVTSFSRETGQRQAILVIFRFSKQSHSKERNFLLHFERIIKCLPHWRESIESVEVLHIAMTNPDCTFLLFLFREILFMFHYRIKQCDIFRILCFCRISLILYWLFGILLFFHLIFFVIKNRTRHHIFRGNIQ